MSILVNNDTRLLVQGITGNSGATHTRGCLEYGTHVVAGVTPGRGGQLFDDKVPIFDTVVEGVADIASKITIGPGLDPASEMGPVISEEQQSRICMYLDS